MLKIAIGFAVFAALALFILVKSGGNVDLGGEKHDVGGHADPVASSASAASAASR